MKREEAIQYLHKLFLIADITDEYGDMCDTEPYETAIDMAIEALKAQQWISCNERLPETDGRYLVTLENGYTRINSYATELTTRHPKGFFFIAENGFAWKQTQNPVIAWMPLPEPAKIGDEYGC